MKKKKMDLNFIQQSIYNDQMYLIPLNETIYYNATQADYATLSTIYLLAFTYHPIYNYLLYLLYGISNGTGYTSFHLLVRNTDTNIFIQNQTLTEDYRCLVDCQIKVTESLLLIQSQHLIGIYTRNGIVKSPAHYQRIKITKNYTIKQINRYADIEFDRFVVVNANDNILVFGRNTNVTYLYPLDYIATKTLDVHLTTDSLYVVADPFWPQIYRFDCLLCLYNGSINNSLPVIPSLTFYQSSMISSYDGFRLHESNYHLNTSTITNGKAFFGFNSKQTSMGLLINDSNSQVSHYYSNDEYYSSANKLDVFMFGRVSNLYRLKLDMSQSSAESYDFGAIIEQMAVNSNSTFVMIRQSGINWKAFQYQIVSNCSNYNASVNSFYPIYCNCHIYAANNRCSLIGSNITNNTNSTNTTNNSTTNVTNSIDNTTNSTNNITNSRTIITNVTTNTTNATTLNNTQTNSTSTQNSESKASFPIAAVIGAVVGIVFLSISGIIIKKNYKRCTKGRRRTPWKYEPIQLMSYEI